MSDVELSPLSSNQVRSLIIMCAREGQAALGRGPDALLFAAECFESAASLTHDYAKPPPPPSKLS